MLKVSWRVKAALSAAALGLAACGGRTISSAASDGGQTGATGGIGGATGGFGGATGGFGGAMGGFGGAMGGFGGAMGGFGGATGGFGGAPTCPPGLLQCGDLCVDPQFDPFNCGACGHVCGAEQLCTQGACTSPCATGATLCGNVCTNLQLDPANCGLCGNVCAPDEICTAGSCMLSCGGGTIPCGNLCVDPTTDPDNCGACGKACPQGQSCANGSCVASTCTNIAPQAIGSTSPGGSTPPYTAVQLNNGLNNAQCNLGWSWVESSGSPYFELAWPSPVAIGSLFIDAEEAAGNPACNVPAGRDIKSASVQYWNGSTWVTAGVIQNQENYSFTFPTKITTSKLRVSGASTSPGNGNPIIYEWYVYPATGCPAPSGV